MTENEQHDQLDRLVRRSFGAPIPADTREALQEELEGVREAWRTKTERPHPVLAVYSIPQRRIRLAAAACFLIVVFAGTRLVLHYRAARKAKSTPAYVFAVAHQQVSYARCTAVFYSKENPTVWLERRMVILDRQGNVTEAIAYSRDGS